MHKSIPIWRDATALMLDMEQVVRHFPRYHKYTLGSEMRQQVMRVCRLINHAFNHPSQQAEDKRIVIQQLVMAVDDLKLQIQLAKELHIFRNFAEFERLSVLAVQIGKQSGGWLRRV